MFNYDFFEKNYVHLRLKVVHYKQITQPPTPPIPQNSDIKLFADIGMELYSGGCLEKKWPKTSHIFYTKQFGLYLKHSFVLSLLLIKPIRESICNALLMQQISTKKEALHMSIFHLQLSNFAFKGPGVYQQFINIDKHMQSILVAIKGY